MIGGARRCVPCLLGLLGLLAPTSACTTDAQLSLGHHQPSLPPSDDAAPPPPDLPEPSVDSSVLPPPMGGTGNPPPSGAAAPPPVVNDAGALAENPCSAGLYAAQLACALANGGFGPQPGGAPPPPPMSTATDLVIEPVQGSSDQADVSGALSFIAWDVQFDARLVGQLDCAAGSFHADIVDGTYRPLSPLAGPPGAFMGRLDAQLDPVTGDLTGNWFHGPQSIGGPRCTGMWTATQTDRP